MRRWPPPKRNTSIRVEGQAIGEPAVRVVLPITACIFRRQRLSPTSSSCKLLAAGPALSKFREAEQTCKNHNQHPKSNASNFTQLLSLCTDHSLNVVNASGDGGQRNIGKQAHLEEERSARAAQHLLSLASVTLTVSQL